MADISLISVNIERSKHLDTAIAFFKKHRPEIATIQECMERDISLFQEVLGAYYLYTPLCRYLKRDDEDAGLYGQAIFSKYPFTSTNSNYYFGSPDSLHEFGEDKEAEIAKVARALSVVEFTKEGSPFRVATTHFTWSLHGEVTDTQRRDLAALFSILDALPQFVLTGDFNAPRGRATWEAIAARYKDYIPAHYTSSIDPMHRAGELPYVVDGIFTTPEYVAKDVELHSGISDHKAITATISKL